jgi:hypothetical protein
MVVQWHYLFFSQDILKVGSEGFGFLRAAQVDLLTMLITAYVPLSRMLE